MIPIILEKLPEALQLTVSREHKDNWELTFVRKAVKNEVEAHERCCMNTSVEKKSPLKKSFNPGNESPASALLSRNRGELNCLFSKGNHRASKCQVVTNIDERREILKKQGRCFKCLLHGGHLHCTQPVTVTTKFSALSAVLVTIWTAVIITPGQQSHLHCILVLGCMFSYELLK